MKPRLPHRSAADVAAADATDMPADEWVPPPAHEFRACCCPGRPLVRVIMPASPSRSRTVDLLLCGHHYRELQAAIAAVHGTVEELPGRSADVAAALFRQAEEPAIPVSVPA